MAIFVIDTFQIIHIPENSCQSVHLRIVIIDHFLIFVLVIYMGAQIGLLTICQISDPLCILVAGNADIPQNNGEYQKYHRPGQRSVEQYHEHRIRLNAKLQRPRHPLLHIPVSGMIAS